MTAPDAPLPLADPALAGLERVTDPGRLAEWLSATLGAEVRVVPRRLRYKPGVSLVMAVDVHPSRSAVDDRLRTPYLVRSYAPRAAAKLHKTVAVSPPGTVVACDDAALVVVTTAAGDRDLPLLARLDAGGLPDVLARVVPERAAGLADAGMRTVSYNPARRWVGVLESGGEPLLTLRAFPQREARRRGRGYAALAGGPPTTPAVAGSSRSYGVVAVEWVAGQELTAAHVPDAWRAAGASVARVHDRGPLPLKHRSSRHEADGVRESAALIAELLPTLGRDATALAEETHRRLLALDHQRTPVHGDFSPDQVVVTPDGGAALVDLDEAHLGDPAADLGSAVAALMGEAEEDDGAARAHEQVGLLIEGYASVRQPPAPAAVATQALGFRVRKALEPFRRCEPDWPDRVAARLRRAASARAELGGGTDS